MAKTDIGRIADLLESNLRRAEHLVAAIDRSAEDAEAADDRAGQIKAIDAIMVFARLALDAITDAQSHAEALNAATFSSAGRA